MNNHISISEAAELLSQTRKVFTEVFKHGTLIAEFYRPQNTDHQTPHDRDEIYVIATGTGTFLLDDKRFEFKVGDFIFVPAGTEHRFEDFSEDFATWVFFYGPTGGEQP